MRRVDFAVITPLPEEFHAVRAHLEDAQEEPSVFPTVVGRIGSFRVVLRMPPDTGEALAADITRQIVMDWNPNWVALIGVAGGFPDQGVGLGDVVFASKIYAYDVGKVRAGSTGEASSFERRDKSDVVPDPGWLSHAKMVADPAARQQGKWTALIKVKQRPDKGQRRHSKLHIGPVASGDKVVDDPSYQFFVEARANLPGLYAVEMEGAGAGASVRNLQAERQLGLLMIRGISDLPRAQVAGDTQPRGREQRDSWKPYAAAAAAAFFEYLLTLPGVPPPLRIGDHQTGSVSTEDLRSALADLSRGTAASLKGPMPYAPRQVLQTAIDNFLLSSRRWCVLVGQSGVGKSLEMAETALRITEAGWAVLLLRGSAFDLDEVARAVASHLPGNVRSEWYPLLIAPWANDLLTGSEKFALLIDGLDERDRSSLEKELVRLADALQNVPLESIKVLLSCGEVAWEDLKIGLPFVNSVPDVAASDVAIVRVDDFNDEELNSALIAIGADEYTISRWTRGRSDPYTDTVRDLLKHPATFGVFAELHQSGALPTSSEITWAGLLDRFVDRVLRRVARQCKVNVAVLREILVSLAGLARKHRRPDFQIDARFVNAALPDFGVNDTDPTSSPYAALMERGLIEESEGGARRRFVGFHLRIVGSYFLSFALEGAVENRSPDEVGEVVTQWLESVYDYPPVVDAITAWAHRLDPADPRYTALVDALIKSRSLRLEVVFRVMPPASANAILEAVANTESHDVTSSHRDAIRAIRPAPKALEAFRHGLYSRNERALKLAIRAAGAGQDVEAILPLIELLDQDNADVQGLASNALGQIGPPAVPYLLRIVEDDVQPVPRRVRALLALRATGFRALEVARALESCLAEAGPDDEDLSKNALLVAAVMRVHGLTKYAIRALSSKYWMVVVSAAKLLTEVPDADAGPALMSALREWSVKEIGPLDRYLVVRQIAMALVRQPTQEHTETIYAVLDSSFRTQASLSSVEAIWLAEKLPLAESVAFILDDLVHGFARQPTAPHIWHNLRALAGVWEPSQLAALDDVCGKLDEQGVNVGQSVVDLLIAASTEAGNHPLKEGNVQREAVKALIKSRTPRLAVHLARLLSHADWPLDQHVSDALWALGDPRAENALLAKLSEPRQEEPSMRRRTDAPILALATCGTALSGDWIVQYLRFAPTGEIEIHFPDLVLLPLLRRGMLDASRLEEIIRDESASQDGRMAAVLALANFDAAAHTEVFKEVVDSGSSAVLRGYAAGALGLTGNASVAPKLVRLLRKSDDPFLVTQAARSLAWLQHDPAVQHIERALEDYIDTWEADELAEALAVFKNPASIPFLLKALERTPFPAVRDRIIECLGEFWPDERAREVVLTRLATGTGGWEDRGQQVPAIHALVRHDPELLLKQALGMIDSGVLEPSAKQALAHALPLLSRAGSAKTDSLITIALEKLVSDFDSWVREQSCQAMAIMPRPICQKVYDALVHGDDVWSTACAVRTLGYWFGAPGEIAAYRQSEHRVVRDAADAAQELRHRREALDTLVNQLGSENAPIRAAALYALKEQGDEAVLWKLGDQYLDDSEVYLFVNSIAEAVNRRRRDEHRKMGREEDRAMEDLGAVPFD